ncbi:MAG: GNAT family N-acetyltransferase [Chitinophagaceae bacterium]|nr:GNAT family N-acetyltransferase [Chitinophagaceae bacterium]
MINFNSSTELILENEIVLLRPLLKDDLPYLLPFALNEPDLWKYSLQNASGIEGMKAYLNLAIESRTSQTAYPFIVFDKRVQQYAGSTRFYDIQTHHQTLQLGYTWYGKDFQGTGINRNCKFLLLQHAFEVMHVKRVEFRADSENARSIAAMKKIGCVEEGLLRSHYVKPDGLRRNSIVLSIIEDDWYNYIKNNLK